ncbi:hypothetical protein BH20BAC1_BH20BAC1_22170 [soil metagenome]
MALPGTDLINFKKTITPTQQVVENINTRDSKSLIPSHLASRILNEVAGSSKIWTTSFAKPLDLGSVMESKMRESMN